MNIVLLEGLAVPQQTIEELAASLKEQGHTFTAWLDGKWDPETLIQRAKDADILMVANSPLPAQVVQACSHLKMISVAFTGVDHIPMDVCKQRGILVCNCAGYSTKAVAELVFGLVLGLARRIPACDGAARHGGTKAGLVGFELAGKTFGIVGTGAIGLRVAALARAFGCKVIAYSRHKKEGPEYEFIEQVSLDELYARADVISLHAPLNDGTRKMINAESIRKMKDGVILINTARGALVDEDALAEGLKTGKIYAAGLDVLNEEPPVHPSALLTQPNATITGHIAWLPKTSRLRQVSLAIHNYQSYLDGKPVSVIN